MKTENIKQKLIQNNTTTVYKSKKLWDVVWHDEKQNNKYIFKSLSVE